LNRGGVRFPNPGYLQRAALATASGAGRSTSASPVRTTRLFTAPLSVMVIGLLVKKARPEREAMLNALQKPE
jgi:hypothetical protein